MCRHADHTEVLQDYSHHVNEVHTDNDRGCNNPWDKYSVQQRNAHYVQYKNESKQNMDSK